MTELLLLRHAHAGDPVAWTKSDDIRPLSKKGRDQAARMAAYLAARRRAGGRHRLEPTRSGRRDGRAGRRRLGLEVRIDERLSEPFGLAEVERLLVDLGDPERPMLVGHDPDFTLARRGPLPRSVGADAQGGARPGRRSAAAMPRLRHPPLAAATGSAPEGLTREPAPPTRR